MIDIVLPKGNELGFVRMAERLGIDGLVLLYPVTADVTKKQSTLAQLQKNAGIRLYLGLSGPQNRLRKARQHADLVVGDPLMAPRQFIESKDCDAVYGLPYLAKHDGIYHRAGGLDHVMAKKAAENGTLVCISYSAFVTAEGKGRILARLRQNLKLCRKFKTPYATASFATDPMLMRAPAECAAFATVLGGSQKQALTGVEERLAATAKLRHMIADGVYSKP